MSRVLLRGILIKQVPGWFIHVKELDLSLIRHREFETTCNFSGLFEIIDGVKVVLRKTKLIITHTQTRNPTRIFKGSTEVTRLFKPY